MDMKQIIARLPQAGPHWVGDGFPVRSVFSYHQQADAISPFLLLDFGGPHDFASGDPARPRGVGQHPHRGFETVTIVFEGEVSHRDSAGGGGTIGAGDVQWMTAGSGIIHQEFHSPAFTASGGRFRMLQLWVNLPARDKMSPPTYQAITHADIPAISLADGAATVRVIAGEYAGTAGPARSFTPINMWEVRLQAGASLTLDAPEGHTTIVVGLTGQATLHDTQPLGEADVLLLAREGQGIALAAQQEASLMILTGAPIDEPIAGHGPFVMNTQEEIRTAIADYNNGNFGSIPA